MRDNTQEIDEILALLDARMPQPKTMNESTARVAMLREAKQAILDWHNKQVEEVLDRLEAQKGTPIALLESKKYEHGVVPLRAIQAERHKLKEPKV